MGIPRLFCEYRLVEPSSGELLVDGVNVLNIPLHELRNNIAIVPQVRPPKYSLDFFRSASLAYLHTTQ